MRQQSSDYLHKNPQFYEQVFEESAAPVCRNLMAERGFTQVSKILDLGCGTGRDLSELSVDSNRCIGVDVSESMISYANQKYRRDGLSYEVGDMRSVRVHDTFDVVLALGSGINYMRSNTELLAAMQTFKFHCRAGGLLIIEPFNTSSCVGSLTPPTEFRINSLSVKAVATATYIWHAETQELARSRIWKFEDSSDEYSDSFRLRLLFARELQFFLENNGFSDIRFSEIQRSKIYPKSLFISAVSV